MALVVEKTAFFTFKSGNWSKNQYSWMVQGELISVV